MLPFPMFRPRCVLPSQVRFHCIASPAFSSFNFPAPSPFSAILTGHRQLNENTTTISPAFAILKSRLKRNPFVCHAYKKHGGWGLPTNHRCSPQPMHFPLFPQRVNIERTATPATPMASCVCFTLPCIPGAGTFHPPLQPHESRSSFLCHRAVDRRPGT